MKENCSVFRSEIKICINEMLEFLSFALHIFYHFNEFFFAHVACPMVPKFYSFIIVNLRQSFYQCHPCCCNFATLQLYNPKEKIRFLKQIYLLFYKGFITQTFELSFLSNIKLYSFKTFLVCKVYLLLNRYTNI